LGIESHKNGVIRPLIRRKEETQKISDIKHWFIELRHFAVNQVKFAISKLEIE